MKHLNTINNLLSLVSLVSSDFGIYDKESLEIFLRELFDTNLITGEYALKIINANQFHLTHTQKICDTGALIYIVTINAVVTVDFDNKKIIECSRLSAKYDVHNWEQDETTSIDSALSELNFPDDFPESITEAINSTEVKTDIIKNFEAGIFYVKDLPTSVSIYTLRNALRKSDESTPFLHLEEYQAKDVNSSSHGSTKDQLQLLYGLKKEIWIDAGIVTAGVMYQSNVPFSYSQDKGVQINFDEVEFFQNPVFFIDNKVIIKDNHRLISETKNIFKTNPKEPETLSLLNLSKLIDPEHKEAHEFFLLNCFPELKSFDPLKNLKALLVN